MTDVRRKSVADMIRHLETHGEQPDHRNDIDTASLISAYPELGRVEVTDLTIPTPHGPQPARLYRLPDTTPAAGLVWAHGGAFVGGHLDMPESHWVALSLAARGISVLAIDYSKALNGVRFPVPSDDVLAAWRHVAAHSAELFGVASDAVLLGGASAGGNLTAGATARLRHAGESVPAGLVLVYPALHPDGGNPGSKPDPEAPHLQLSLNFAGSAEALADPHAFPGIGRGEGFPPTLIVVCERDGLRPSGEAFARLLEKAGVDITLHLEPDADHGHINEPADPTALRTIDAIADWVGTGG